MIKYACYYCSEEVIEVKENTKCKKCGERLFYKSIKFKKIYKKI